MTTFRGRIQEEIQKSFFKVRWWIPRYYFLSFAQNKKKIQQKMGSNTRKTSLVTVADIQFGSVLMLVLEVLVYKHKFVSKLI